MSNKNLQVLAFVFFVIALLLFEASNLKLSDNVLVSSMLSNSIFRIIGGGLFLTMMCSYGYRKLYKFPFSINTLYVILPALIISINNFPIIAYFSNRAYLVQPIYTVYVFILECFSSAFFEEIIFRSIILIFLLERFNKTKQGVFKAIIWSSVFFSLLHLMNLFSGSSFYNVSLQLGYSFLMGMLWAVMYLKTKNIWITIILHASYNFFGQVMFSLGIVNGRYDIYTIIITVFLALGVTVYGFQIFQRLPNDISQDFSK